MQNGPSSSTLILAFFDRRAADALLARSSAFCFLFFNKVSGTWGSFLLKANKNIHLGTIQKSLLVEG